MVSPRSAHHLSRDGHLVAAAGRGLPTAYPRTIERMMSSQASPLCYECSLPIKPTERPLKIEGYLHCYACYRQLLAEGAQPSARELEDNDNNIRWMRQQHQQRQAEEAKRRAEVPAVAVQPKKAPVAPVEDQEAIAAREEAKRQQAQAVRDGLARLEQARRAHPRKFIGGATGVPRSRTLRWATCWRCGADFRAKSSPTNRPQFCRSACGTAYRRAVARGLDPRIEGAELAPPRPATTLAEFEAMEGH